MFTEMQAAIGNIQLKKLNKILNKKKYIYNFYKKNLSNINEISFMKPIKSNEPVYWFSNILVNKKKQLKKFLFQNGIQTRDVFLPLNLQPCFKNKNYIKNLKGDFKKSEEIYNKGISLPSHYNLKIEDLKYILNKINNFFKK